jgi:hypothetical protein
MEAIKQITQSLLQREISEREQAQLTHVATLKHLPMAAHSGYC